MVNKGRKYSILGIVFAVLSLVVLPISLNNKITFIIFPIIFNIVAVLFGVLAVKEKDNKLGVLCIVFGLFLALLSVLLGMLSFY